MADLPMEIFSHHIFLKLPFKSLQYCKLVCKAWNRVIRNPVFVIMHLHQHNHHRKLLIATSDPNPIYYSTDYEASTVADAVKLNINFPAEPLFLGSSNGLLCIFASYRKRKYSDHDNHNDEDIMIWNPATGDSKVIPNTDPPLPYFRFPYVGFGHDSSINDVKIVRFTDSDVKVDGHPIASRVYIYSLKSNSWSIIDKYDVPLSSFVRGRGCAVNGSIYWLARFYIVGFNIKDNNFRKLQLPATDFLPCNAIYLEELGGTLGMVRITIANGLVVWTMKDEEKEEWTKLINIEVSVMNCGESRFMKPMCLTMNGEVLLLFHERLITRRSSSEPEHKFRLYDPITDKTKYFHVRGIGEHKFGFSKVLTYVESLVSLNSISQGA